MTFEERQREIFFDGFHEISGGELTHWLEKELVLQWIGTKIIRKKADDIFTKFTERIKYVEENDNKKYRISDSGKVYYEFLKKETRKYDLEKESIEASIKSGESTITTGRYTRNNIIFASVLGSLTFLALIINLWITIKRDNRQEETKTKDSTQQSKTLQSVQELKIELHQISLSLKDTAKVKVKIEK